MVIEIKTKKPRKEKPPMEAQWLELGTKWHAYAKANTKTKPYPCWSDEYFAKELFTVAKRTEVSVELLTQVLEFLEQDDFWKPNGLSPKSLLNISKNNQKRKLDNILDAKERASKPFKGASYDRPKAIDYSADNGKFANCNDDKPW